MPRVPSTFEHDKGWLAHTGRFGLEPALKLGPGPFHTASGSPLFGAIGDSAPDRWGRVLMRRAERRRAESQGATPRTVREIDFLLMVDDEARQGFAFACFSNFAAGLAHYGTLGIW